LIQVLFEKMVALTWFVVGDATAKTTSLPGICLPLLQIGSLAT
jgi:hypothetical protein